MENRNYITRYSERCVGDDFQVIVDVVPPVNIPCDDKRSQAMLDMLSSIDSQKRAVDGRIAELNADIDRLTSTADGFDYALAAVTGVICGIIDITFVGEFDLDGALEKAKSSDAYKKVDQFVMDKAIKVKVDRRVSDKVAKELAKGNKMSRKEIKNFRKFITKRITESMSNEVNLDAQNSTRNAMAKAISILEEKFKLPLDNAYDGVKGLNSVRHHLDDYAHRPTLLGLVAAICGTFFRFALFSDKKNHLHFRFERIDFKDWLRIISPLLISGILIWLLYMAQKKQKEITDSDLPAVIKYLVLSVAASPAMIQIIKVVQNWVNHLASDMAGSASSARKGKMGMGIPGFMLSSLKQFSVFLPMGEKSREALATCLNDLYEKDHLDLRAELGMAPDILKHLGKQAVPVILGQVVVRSFYFIRHLVSELSDGRKLDDVNWKNVIPFNNRTIARMITVESSVFSAIDIGQAVCCGMKDGGPQNPLFWKDLILNINFVGIGNCAIAVAVDAKMGIRRQQLINERLADKNKSLAFQSAELCVYQSDMWNSAENAAEALFGMVKTAKVSAAYMDSSISRMNAKWSSCEHALREIHESDPDFFNEAFGDL